MSSDSKLDLVKKIAEAFPNHKTIMVAIAIEESGLNPKATSYNCRYKIATKDDSNREFDKLTRAWINLDKVSSSKKQVSGYVSTYCRKRQENLAWSKDGGLLQINNPSKEHYIVENNLETAKNKLESQGLNAWVSYSTGRYKANLDEAKQLLSQIQ